ncbi:MAG: HAD-IIB family hydrolase [Pseudomonadota bacterium]
MHVNRPIPFIVFSDLDGTLLDHHDYSFDAARPALAALRAAGVPVVLATSKTGAEVRVVQADLDLTDCPAIVENGAGVIWPDADRTDDDSAYRDIRRALAALDPDLRARFRGFGDLGAEAVAQVTGLAPDAARAACARQFSEPGLWDGTAEARDDFCAVLAENGIHARQGGRFLTLLHGRTKADAMAEVVQKLRAGRSVALGDAPNDVEMLESADIGIIIRNDNVPTLPPLTGEETGRIRRSAHPGPAGWNACILQLLRAQED